jgi:hypothetical protein
MRAKKIKKTLNNPLPDGFKARSITYECKNSSCKPDTKFKHMDTGDVLTLIAKNVEVTITFGLNGTPLIPPTNPIVIPKGTAQAFVVGGVSGTHYDYKIRCLNPRCASSVDDPEMIVD